MLHSKQGSLMTKSHLFPVFDRESISHGPKSLKIVVVVLVVVLVLLFSYVFDT